MRTCPPEFLAFAHRLADAGGDVVRRYYRSSFAVEGKGDLSPVTVADRETEEVLRGLIEREFPSHGIWGEEYGAARMDAEWVWTLDPIDGTRAFMTGRPTFGTLIGLLHQGVPVLGVIDQPALKERWIGGPGYPTQCNGQAARVRACSSLGDAISIFGPPPFPHVTEGELRPFRNLAEITRSNMVAADCYAHAMLASGYCDLVVESGLKLHDFTALAPVVIGAGGMMTDWEGKPLGLGSKGDIVAAGDKRVWEEAVRMVIQ